MPSDLSIIYEKKAPHCKELSIQRTPYQQSCLYTKLKVRDKVTFSLPPSLIHEVVHVLPQNTCSFVLLLKGSQGDEADFQEGKDFGGRKKTKASPPVQLPGAYMCITVVFKERVLSGSRQHPLTCQVQNLIP
jgi:hypothetical protein